MCVCVCVCGDTQYTQDAKTNTKECAKLGVGSQVSRLSVLCECDAVVFEWLLKKLFATSLCAGLCVVDIASYGCALVVVQGLSIYN